MDTTEQSFLAIDAYFPSQNAEPPPQGTVTTRAEGRSSGGYHARFLYVTNPTYLILDPARLGFLSAGLLTPPTQVERVTFLNGDCALAPGLLSGPIANATLAAMYEQIFRALHSSSRDTTPLVRRNGRLCSVASIAANSVCSRCLRARK